MANLGRPRESQVQVQSGSARYSAEKTHHVLYFRKGWNNVFYNFISGYRNNAGMMRQPI